MMDSKQNDNQYDLWKGVTFEELRFMRATSLIRLEMQKAYLQRKVNETFSIKNGNTGELIHGISSKLTFIQKALLFVKGVKLATSLFSFFRKNKRR